MRLVAYNRLCSFLRRLAHRLSLLAPNDPYRLEHEQVLLKKLYDMGILDSKSQVERKVTVSAFARRRPPVVITRLHMADTVQAAVESIEQGHVRVGETTISNSAYLVSRNMEAHITWSHGSKIKTNISRYHNQLDDFDLLSWMTVSTGVRFCSLRVF
jgi:U3 small nucleolar ribonucleoprotein protein IMP3